MRKVGKAESRHEAISVDTKNKGRSPHVGACLYVLMSFLSSYLGGRSVLKCYFLYTPPDTVPGS